ncbi:MAG: carboxy-S-adenosyl-L-methionine synthase CmoA [Gammaproteobacteria bacterium]|nr:carboxy-S-adenosyl-L-methionine synthase CmoA [Gammaproteobacteria bacterium]
MKKNSHRDQIFANQQVDLVDFVFDERVVAVFPDMIRRSVPGYDAIISNLAVFSQAYVKANTRCYDLGASLGASSLAMASSLAGRNCEIIAVDNAQAMLDQCAEVFASYAPHTKLQTLCANIQDISISNASMAVCNFTLQFIKSEERQLVINTVFNGLNPGGVLILSEKVLLANEQQNQQFVDWHLGFKRANGYSDLEISQKRAALENVLIPETVETHIQRLTHAGFSQVYVWFQCFNFVSLFAQK